MSNISTSFLPALGTDFAGNTSKSGNARKSGFDAMLMDAGARADVKEFANKFIENIMLSLDESLNALVGKSAPKNAYPFSTDFEATFGSSGPLIDFINTTTSRLNLSVEQNQALQAIAVRNKDITKTTANVQKIADELKQAGIV